MRKLLLAILAGSSFGISLLSSFTWPLVFVGVVVTLIGFREVRSYSRTFYFGWMVGTIKMLWSIGWFWSAYPADWMGLEAGPFHIFLVLLYWVPISAVLGLGLGLVGYIYKKHLINIQSLWIHTISFGVLWVFGEMIGAVFFSIFMAGPGSTVNAGFSFGHTGYALVHHNVLLLTATLGGVYGLSFLVGIFGGIMLHSGTKTRMALLALILVTAFLPVALPATPSIDTRVAVIETAFPAGSKGGGIPIEEVRQIHLGYLQAALASESDVIVLPEDARLTNWFSSPEELFTFVRLLSPRDVVIIDSLRDTHNGETVLRSYVYDTKTQTRYYFDKQYLVPQGEFLPYVYRALITLLTPPDFLLNELSGLDYVPGIAQADVEISENVPPVLFCFESVTPFGVKNVNSSFEDPDFVAHVISHAWFKRQPETLWHQLQAMLRVQAIWNRVPIMQAANEAPYGAYSSSGQLITPYEFARGNRWRVGVIDL